VNNKWDSVRIALLWNTIFQLFFGYWVVTLATRCRKSEKTRLLEASRLRLRVGLSFFGSIHYAIIYLKGRMVELRCCQDPPSVSRYNSRTKSDEGFMNTITHFRVLPFCGNVRKFLVVLGRTGIARTYVVLC
jgi:hypothetical protein